MPPLRHHVEAMLRSVHHQSPMLLRDVRLLRWRQESRGEVVTPATKQATIDVLLIIARIMWVIIRTCLTVIAAVVIGGMRGLGKARMKSSAQK